jgi:iron-sulfur cluster repair protein YtfE (RIC family)
MSYLEPSSAPADALRLLCTDHEEVADLFDRYRQLTDEGAGVEPRVALATQICFELLVHAQVEEELFYPAAREMLQGQDMLVDESLAEHEAAKELIVRLESIDPADEQYDATVLLLAEAVAHHVREEEDVLFPRLRAHGALDLDTLGEALAARKQALFDEVLAEVGETIGD